MNVIGEAIVELVKSGRVYDATLVTTMGEVRVTQSILGNAIILLGEDVFDEEFPDIPDDDILTISMIPCEGQTIPPVDFKYDHVPFPDHLGGLM